MSKRKLDACPRCSHILMVGSPYPELRICGDDMVYYEHDFCNFLTKGAKTEEEARQNWNDKNFCPEFFEQLTSWEKSMEEGFFAPLKIDKDNG